MILRPASSLTNKLSIKVHVARIYPFVLPSQWLPTPNLHATLQLTCGPAVLTNVTPHTAFVCRSFLPLSSRPASPSIHKDAILHSAAALVQRQAKLIRSTSLAPNASRKAISAIDVGQTGLIECFRLIHSTAMYATVGQGNVGVGTTDVALHLTDTTSHVSSQRC
jgi:hypothetical protein